VEPDLRRNRSVEAMRANRVLHLLAKLRPVIRLGENRLGQALGNKATVRLLGHFEDQLVHVRDRAVVIRTQQREQWCRWCNETRSNHRWTRMNTDALRGQSFLPAVRKLRP